jgi:hypothetical protein
MGIKKEQKRKVDNVLNIREHYPVKQFSGGGGKGLSSHSLST